VMDSTQDVLSMGFYARHNTRIVMWANLGGAGLNVALSFLLVKPFGIAGLAWATTLASAGLALALYWLNRQMDSSPGEERGLALALLRTGLACGGMAALIAGVGRLGLGIIPYLIVSIGGGCLVYAGLHTLLGGREIHAVWKNLVGSGDKK
jgi:putative peptidoglycan lipid II flippase